MKAFLIIIFGLISLIGNCQIPEMNNPKEFPYQVNEWLVDSINNKPINFYLNNPAIDKYSKLFYQGKFAVSDDELTFAFLDSVLTTNQETKDFYLYVFNCVLRITDGALSEYIGQDCKAYLEKYPCDFIKLKNNKLYSDNYEKWIDFAAYEFYFDENPIEKTNEKFKMINHIVKKNCVQQSSELENIRLKIIVFIKENE
ncbi:hypothetical protein [Robertkochia solimangrovi]|uniref:hypothetical protein n=1 Tax=Robertkochia solimangrovi TaxID=2213046 RepID=UPI001180E4F5|nr:hypothetical protein [Robertkochia solimangrovi]TRZ43144.1 hypothetical protein DMZ48_10650 [Robertkochia solimangrovi]